MSDSHIELLTELLAQAEALIVVAHLDGLELREDLRSAYWQALHNIVEEARTIVARLTTATGE
ncbi:MAG: hypothetical protein IPF57_10285 [Gammaproteobacteria bacterium]|jgi:hypothetical protein|nr:hypothetical protein [Gammaproteobacteria bacterium]